MAFLTGILFSNILFTFCLTIEMCTGIWLFSSWISQRDSLPSSWLILDILLKSNKLVDSSLTYVISLND